MAEICEASSGERLFVTSRFTGKIRQVIFVLKKELYLVSPTEKLVLRPSLRRKTGITSRLSLSLSFTSYHVRFAW